jgi:hypothetical protein
MATKSNRRQRGYTLLEYCAGAAVVAGVLWTSLSQMGSNIGSLMESVGSWATSRGAIIERANQ